MTAQEARAIMPDTRLVRNEALNIIFSEIEQVAKNGYDNISYSYSNNTGDSWLSKYRSYKNEIINDLAELGYKITEWPDMKIITINW